MDIEGDMNMVFISKVDRNKDELDELHVLGEKFDIYYIKETGLGFKGEGDNAKLIDIESAIDFLNEHGTRSEYKEDLLDDGIEYLVIFGGEDEGEHPGLAIPEILCDYLKKKGYVEQV